MVKTISREAFYHYLAVIGAFDRLLPAPAAPSAGASGIAEDASFEEPPRPYRKRYRAAEHLRNTTPMLTSPRCGAKTRSGSPCRSPAVSGKQRCRMHGGASGSGAQLGNLNALKGDPDAHRSKMTRLMIRRYLRGSKYKLLRRQR